MEQIEWLLWVSMGLGVLNLIYSVSIIYLVRQEIKELNN